MRISPFDYAFVAAVAAVGAFVAGVADLSWPLAHASGIVLLIVSLGVVLARSLRREHRAPTD